MSISKRMIGYVLMILVFVSLISDAVILGLFNDHFLLGLMFYLICFYFFCSTCNCSHVENIYEISSLLSFGLHMSSNNTPLSRFLTASSFILQPCIANRMVPRKTPTSTHQDAGKKCESVTQQYPSSYTHSPTYKQPGE